MTQNEWFVKLVDINEFKLEAVGLAERDGNAAQVARDLGLKDDGLMLFSRLYSYT